MEIIGDPLFLTFGQDGSLWETQGHGPVRLKASVQDGIVLIQQTGATGAHWQGEMRYAPFAVRKGQLARLTFEMQASEPTGFSAWIGQWKSPWRSLVSKEEHFGQRQVGPEWTTYHFAVRITEDEEEARLNFVFGERDNLVGFRNISVELE